MWYPTILLFSVIVSPATAGDSALPAHYNDLESYLLSRMNFSADPCNDFYTYACGNSDYYEATVTNENRRILKNGLDKLISSGQRNYTQTSAYGKALRLYEACVNENITKTEADAHTKKGVNVFLNKFNFPTDFFFNDNATVDINRKQFSNILKYVHDTFFIEPFFEIQSLSAKLVGKREPKNLGVLAFTTVRKSFKRTAYECNSPKLFEKFIESVRNVNAAMGLMATESKIKETARELMDFELRLNKISCGRNNVTITTDGQYFDVESLTFENYGIDLNNYIRSLIATGIGNHDADIVFYIGSLRKVLESTSDADLLRYIYFRIINKNSVEIDCADALTPMKLIKSRIYTEFKYASAEEREYFSNGMKFTNVVDVVKEQLQNMVLTMPWIRENNFTFRYFSKKFETMRAEVAIENILWNNTYLDEYYDQLRFNGNDSFFDMYSKAQQFDVYGKVRSILRDATDFEHDLTVFNAGFMKTLNKFVINDGYLIAPLYNRNYAFSFNFGSIAAVIGHEIGHSVDSDGIYYDGNGFRRPLLSLLISILTKREWEKMKLCLFKQYNGIQVLPNNYTTNQVNGFQTIDENMADISGIEAAFRAFESVKSVGNLSVNSNFSHPKLHRLTQDQLFFLGSVNSFCDKRDFDDIHYSITSDPHTPNIARVQSLTNVPAFGKAFNCPVGSKFRPTEYCRVWTHKLSLIDILSREVYSSDLR